MYKHHASLDDFVTAANAVEFELSVHFQLSHPGDAECSFQYARSRYQDYGLPLQATSWDWDWTLLSVWYPELQGYALQYTEGVVYCSDESQWYVRTYILNPYDT